MEEKENVTVEEKEPSVNGLVLSEEDETNIKAIVDKTIDKLYDEVKDSVDKMGDKRRIDFIDYIVKSLHFKATNTLESLKKKPQNPEEDEIVIDLTEGTGFYDGNGNKVAELSDFTSIESFNDKTKEEMIHLNLYNFWYDTSVGHKLFLGIPIDEVTDKFKESVGKNLEVLKNGKFWNYERKFDKRGYCFDSTVSPLIMVIEKTEDHIQKISNLNDYHIKKKFIDVPKNNTAVCFRSAPNNAMVIIMYDKLTEVKDED